MYDTRRVRVLAALDKFKGTATSAELGQAVVAAAIACGHDASAIVVSDGGDGLLDVVGGPNRTSTVTGPLGRPVDAGWRLDETTAVIESARACGLVRAGGRAGNDPMRATSTGVGELIDAAVVHGATRVVVGVGGSACTDGGMPALDAMHDDTRAAIASGAIEVLVCCDVTTRFVDAAAQFAPQKGADEVQVRLLRDRLVTVRQTLLERFGRDVGALPGSGAAGGLAGGLAALGATLRSGFDVVVELTGIADAVRGADLVVTGEGRLDQSSFAGKVVGGVAALAARHGTAVVAVVGVADELDVAFDVVSLTERFGARRAQDDVLECAADTVTSYLAQQSAKY